jgi:hemin uptake protein HemP
MENKSVAAKEQAAPGTGEAFPVIAVEQLLGEKREAFLVHRGETYRLRITNNDRLILTK